jgi:two-component system, sensor histidine kinase and response regulator
MRSPHVLLIDDDEMLLDALPGVLRTRLPQVNVETFSNAPRAIERLHEVRPGAIVSDLRMPGMDGLAFLAEVKRQRPYTPFILITGECDRDLTTKLLGAGAYDVIPKPIERDLFVKSVRQALETDLLRRQAARQSRLLARLTAHLKILEQEIEPSLRERLGALPRQTESACMEDLRQFIERALLLVQANAQSLREQTEFCTVVTQWQHRFERS